MKSRKIKLTITGCLGRMGQQLIKSANKDNRFRIISFTENKILKKNFWIITINICYLTIKKDICY